MYSCCLAMITKYQFWYNHTSQLQKLSTSMFGLLHGKGTCIQEVVQRRKLQQTTQERPGWLIDGIKKRWWRISSSWDCIYNTLCSNTKSYTCTRRVCYADITMRYTSTYAPQANCSTSTTPQYLTIQPIIGMYEFYWASVSCCSVWKSQYPYCKWMTAYSNLVETTSILGKSAYSTFNGLAVQGIILQCMCVPSSYNSFIM